MQPFNRPRTIVAHTHARPPGDRGTFYGLYYIYIYNLQQTVISFILHIWFFISI